MLPTAGIERCAAVRTDILTVQILPGCECLLADATEHGRLIKTCLWPHCWLVVGDCLVTLETGIVRLTAAKSERNHVDGVVPVCTSGLPVDSTATEWDRKPVVCPRTSRFSSAGHTWSLRTGC